MARVRDLTAAEGDDEILHRTEASGGLLGRGGRLLSRPLADRLADGEVARYLLRNSDAGLTIEGADGERTVDPDGDYQAFALVTDRRLCVVAGGADGDKVVSLPLADVLAADVERAGLLSTQLVVEAPDGRRFTFPCKGDLDAVVERLRDDGSAWAHAERLLDDADAATDRAREHLDAGDLGAARAALDDAEDHWAAALDALAPVHEAAVAGLAERVDVRRDLAAGLRGEIEATAGARAHARAERAWDARDYETAASAYDEAIAGYRESAGLPGSQPSDEALRRRLTGAAAERAVLRVAPVADAEALAGRAAETADPADAAVAWERAHERFRGLLGLSWDGGDRQFVVDREGVRTAAADAADQAVDGRLEVARRWTAAGDRLAADGNREAADRLYDRASVHLDRAMALARSVLPGREADVEARQAAVDGRRDGSIEPDPDPDAPLPADAPEGAEAAVTGRVESPEPRPAGVEQAGEDREAEQGPPTDAEQGTPTDAEAVTAPNAANGGDEDADQSNGEREGAGEAPKPSSEREASPTDVASAIDAADDPTSEPETVADPDVGGGTGPPLGAEDVAGRLDDVDEDRATVVEALRVLDGAALSSLVADVWRARGWSTTVFTASESAVYDVLGVDPETDRRLLCWTDGGPDGGSVDPGTIARIATTRDRLQESDVAVLVTTGSVPEGTRERAASLGVTVVDVDGLGDLLAATDMLERVTAQAD